MVTHAAKDTAHDRFDKTAVPMRGIIVLCFRFPPTQMTNEFDFIIIGSGTAGSLLAKRLSQDPANSVALIEAGPPDRHPFIHIPAGFMRIMTNPAINWLYETEPSQGTGGRSIKQPRGKTLGGSSSINGHIYNRGQRTDYDVWAQLGNRGWDYASVLPYFKRGEKRVGDADHRFRGTDGEFAVTDLHWDHPLCEAFIDGAVSMGIPRNADYNGARQDGVGYFQRSIYKRRRMSAARAFLHPVRGRKNLRVYTNTHVLKINLEGKRATSISCSRGGGDGDTIVLSARREIIVSGGTFNSPQLLQLSGIGPPPLLKELGIEVAHALSGVGENLRDHYGVRLVARVKGIETINERSRGLKLGKEIFSYFTGGQSILNLQPTLVHVFWKSRPALDQSDLQMTFTPASYREGVQSSLDEFAGATVAVWQQRPTSSGYVRAISRDPYAKPVIQPNYFAQSADQKILLDGMKLARRLLSADALMRYVEREDLPGPQVQSDDEWRDFARRRGTTTFHPVGTCAMGPSTNAGAVVDDQLRVHGLEGLRVVDASVMPTMVSANTNAATLMIADKAADMILARSPLPAVELNDD
jgi:choline dehydrogenase